MAKLVEIEGFVKYLGAGINNRMGKVSEHESRVSRLGGGREDCPWHWDLPQQRMFEERLTSVLEMFVSYTSRDKELTVSCLGLE